VATHIENRDTVVLGALTSELMGPSTTGSELDCSGNLSFDTPAAAAGPWREKGTGQEIIVREAPGRRYGVGVLYPFGTVEEEVEGETEILQTDSADHAAEGRGAEQESDVRNTDQISSVAIESIQSITTGASRNDSSSEPDDLAISAINAYRPSSMGITFLADLSGGATVAVSVSGGRYRQKKVLVAGKDRIWWIRRDWVQEFKWAGGQLSGEQPVTLQGPQTSGDADFDLRVEVYSRPYGSPTLRMLTVTLINRTTVGPGAFDQYCLFQAGFSVTVGTADGKAAVRPYPEPATRAVDEEERSINLLYRHSQTYAIGHGCAADWSKDRLRLAATCLPTFETPWISSDVRKADGSPLVVSMALLAGLRSGQDGFRELGEIIEAYGSWIAERKKEAASIDSAHRAAASNHLGKCDSALERMRLGLKYLRDDPIALEAFRLANKAILLQQVRGSREARSISYDERGRCWKIATPFPEITYEGAGKGTWRAFQIAFLLMSMRSAVDGRVPDRKIVELIWFPTGGGKTEAYLGLSAFAMFVRRLRNPADAGVNVLMRYTLRLLTAQQFQRASGLITAMEYLRRAEAGQLGGAPFSIGIWLGDSTTPNKRSDAIHVHRDLLRGEKAATNKFILSRCPWCAAQMGPFSAAAKLPRNVSRCPGYERDGPTISLKCTDSRCNFASGLPVFVIDEDIYERRPTLIIGTVDKFAMLAWEPKARSLFGLSTSGERDASPPGLIIQDELHLISGPLGSMVGLYEGVIEELCTDRRVDPPVIPKIVSSTATIRRYEDQVKSLYGRSSVALFPPPGLTAGDSFFATYERRQDGSLAPGRKYVGVYAPGLGSQQTVQVRTFSILLQSVQALPTKAEQDPWWTLLTFFNSLRELGTTLSLFQSDIPDYLKTLRLRYQIPAANARWIRNVLELTGRLRGDEVQDAIDSLDVTTGSANSKAVDVCLASNIIEVGIDINRLSLICIVGQPKTTSQYIQVTGRVGRQMDRPGLVVMLYGASKPRDRSHFERFRSYHERLYAYVEPTSVTPFSPPALDRALHAVMAAYARQAGGSEIAGSPHPYPEGLMGNLQELLRERVKSVDLNEASNLEKVFEMRARQWKRWQRIHWRGNPTVENTPLLRAAGAFAPQAVARVSWATPMSMRNVDAECEIEITQNYLHSEAVQD
jgi:hypothetical protein